MTGAKTMRSRNACQAKPKAIMDKFDFSELPPFQPRFNSPRFSL